jgi:hypothetical protein
MNEQELLAMALLGAGAAAARGLALGRRSPVEPPEVWLRLLWPRAVDAGGVAAFLRQLAGDRRRHIVAIEVVAGGERLSYRIGLAERHQKAVLAALAAHLPGVASEVIEHDLVHAPGHAWQLAISSGHHALRTNRSDEVARSLTAALATAGEDSGIMLQWLLGPRLEPTTAPAKGTQVPAESWCDALRQTVARGKQVDAELQKALREKTAEPGFRCICRIGVSAPSVKDAQAIAMRVLAALCTAEAPGVRLKLLKDDPAKLAAARRPRSWPLAVNILELTGLCGWPLGEGAYIGVQRTAARLLPVPERVARQGRVVGVSTYPGAERALALSPADSLQHLHALGPTGTGKSTMLLSLAVQDIRAGRGIAVVDPKGDLVEALLERMPEGRLGDLVVLDPADEERPVGLNVLAGSGRPAELVADQVLAVFHDLYRDSWGPRTQDILHAALLTLATKPGMTLCALPVLLSSVAFRRRAVAGITDEVALRPFWTWYESLTDGERQQAIAPVMNKLRAFLLRPRMRAVIGQSTPSFDIGSVFTERKVLLVSLAKGLVGPEASALLGSLVVSQLWQAALGRAALPADERHPAMIYIDEFQDYLHLPTDVAEVLAQARGLGVGLTLAHQHLAQLPTAMRSAVLANARSRVCFQLGSEDARLIASSSAELEAVDLQGLGRFEAYASLVGRGAVTPYASLRTLPPLAPTQSASQLRKLSRERYGRDLAEVESGLAALVSGGADDDDRPIGRRRRT